MLISRISNVEINTYSYPQASNMMSDSPGSPIIDTPSRPSVSGPSSATIGRPVTLAPSRSAFKQHNGNAAGAAAAGGRTNEWGVALRHESEVGSAPPPSASSGVLNRISDLVFGW